MKNYFKIINILIILYFINSSLFGIDSEFIFFTKENHNDTIFYKPEFIDSLTIGIALSGGGARGTAHLGFLKGMEEVGLPISQLTGSSIGSVLGALYIAGYTSEEILQIVQEYDWEQIYNNKADRTDIIVPQKKHSNSYFLTLRLSERGPFIPISLSSGQKLLEKLNYYLTPLSFHYYNDYGKMPIPFKIISTDLLKGEKVLLDRGSLGLNLLSSMSYPLIFSPVKIDEKLLIDGGIADNIPVDELDSNLTLKLASDVSAGLRGKNYLRAPWQIADQVTTIMMKYNLSRFKEADLVFQPPVKEYSSTDFKNLKLFFDKGYSTFQQRLMDVKRALKSKLHKNVNFVKINIKTLIIKENKKLIWQLDSTFYLNSLIKKLYKLKKKLPSTIKYIPSEKQLVLTYPSDNSPDFVKVWLDSSLIFFEKIINKINLFEVPSVLLEDPIKLYRTRLEKMGFICENQDLNQKGDTLLIRFKNIVVDDIEIDRKNLLTKNYIIKRELDFQPGDKITRDNLIKSYKNLYGLDLFNRIEIFLTKDRSNKNIVHIRLEEKPFTAMKLGVHADKNFKGEINLRFQHNNLLGHNFVANFDFLLGTKRRITELYFSSNRIWTSNFGLFMKWKTTWESRDLYQNHNNLGHFSYNLNEYHVGLGKYLEKLGYTSFSVFFRIEKGITFPTNMVQKSTYHEYGFRLESIVDKRNFIPIATSGSYSKFSMESYTIKSKQKIWNMNKATIALQSFFKISKYSILHPFFNGGIMENQAPFITWFGVTENLRKSGWNLYEYYGKAYSVAGLTLYQKIFPFFWGEKYFSFTFDAGKYWKDSEKGFNWDDFQLGARVGLTLSTIAGPITISYEINHHQKPFLWFSAGFRY